MYDEFKDEIDFIVDNGEMDAEPSTIIDITSGFVKVLRQGQIIIPDSYLQPCF